MKYYAYHIDTTDDTMNITGVTVTPFITSTEVSIEVILPLKIRGRAVPHKVWLPARPVPYRSLLDRIRDAWLAFTDKADLLIWPGQ